MAYTPIFIDDYGIHVNTYADILTYLQNQMRSIYGQDIVLDASAQDGQLIAIFAKAIFDAEQSAQATYFSFSPATATGIALSNNVAINGISRLAATFSTVDVILTGTANTQILNGVIYDQALQYRWNLPTPLIIPSSGTLNSTATCQVPGNILIAANTATGIFTPVSGWTGVTNPLPSNPGNPVESDAALRVRQMTSVARPSQSIIAGLTGDLLALTGVTSAVVYENPNDNIDTTTTPNRQPHSIAAVVSGGALTDIATAIFLRKTLGVNTAGFPTGTPNTQMVTISPAGVSPVTITFYRPLQVAINVVVNIKPLPNWAGANTTQIQTLIENYLNAFVVGADVFLTKLITAAYNTPIMGTYDITTVVLSATGKTPDSAGNILLNDNEQAVAGAITFNVTP